MDHNDRTKRTPMGRSVSEPPGRIDRRAFLARTAGIAGATVSGALAAGAARGAYAAEPNPLGIAPWQTVPGTPAGGYGQPSPFEKSVLRHLLKPYGDLAPGTGPSFTPIEALEGTITPSGLHFVRNHNGVPEIDPARHRLMIHGLVKRPLIFTVDALLRYPTVSRPHFLECSGNSSRALTPQPLQIPAGGLHGMVSCSEWTGIPLSGCSRKRESIPPPGGCSPRARTRRE
jgi:sulfane dehydrogenase subunit SoxC